MKLVAVYGENGSFICCKEVNENYTLKSNETNTIPNNELLNPKFDGTNWIGCSKEEFTKATTNISRAQTPSMSAMIQMLGKTVAVLNQQVVELRKSKEGTN